MPEAAQRMRHLVKDWAAIAHERDLRKALTELRGEVDRWDRGEIDSHELNQLVHRFHDGVSREIWKRYATSHLEPAVASAVVAGVLKKKELPDELLRHIAGLIESYDTISLRLDPHDQGSLGLRGWLRRRTGGAGRGLPTQPQPPLRGSCFLMPVIVLLAARMRGEGPGDRTREPRRSSRTQVSDISDASQFKANKKR
jgi:hypothetical protein